MAIFFVNNQDLRCQVMLILITFQSINQLLNTNNQQTLNCIVYGNELTIECQIVVIDITFPCAVTLMRKLTF